MAGLTLRERSGVIRFDVRVQPRASKNEIVGVQNGALRVRLRAPPIDGAANDALIELLADELGVSRRLVQIASGFGSRDKSVEVDSSARRALDRIAAST
ncbi:MAG: DUF167 domain-containing protein [Vicinamibacterales bacterium]